MIRWPGWVQMTVIFLFTLLITIFLIMCMLLLIIVSNWYGSGKGWKELRCFFGKWLLRLFQQIIFTFIGMLQVTIHALDALYNFMKHLFMFFGIVILPILFGFSWLMLLSIHSCSFSLHGHGYYGIWNCLIPWLVRAGPIYLHKQFIIFGEWEINRFFIFLLLLHKLFFNASRWSTRANRFILNE